MRGVGVSENLQKLVGVVVMAVLVVVGVVVSSGDDDFTRNAAFIKFDGFRELPEAEQARLAPAFLEQAAPKSLDTGPINKINSEVGPIFKGAKASIQSTGAGSAGIWLQSGGTDALSTGKASVLQGRGVDGKGGTSSYCTGYCMDGKTGKGGTSSLAHAGTASPSYPVLSGRKAEVWRQEGNATVVADRIAECASGGNEEMKERAAPSIIAILIALFSDGVNGIQEACANGTFLQGAVPDAVRIPVDPSQAKLLAECMESKVGGVFLKSHINVSAGECVATVMPALSPERAKRLGTYWQTPEQLTALLPALASETNEE